MNLQQIPSANKMEGFRECFSPHNDNRYLITADYSSQEIRILADKTQERSMIAFLNGEDQDFHSFSARRMWEIPEGTPVPKDKRQAAKILSFLIAYGGGAVNLARKLKIPLEKAEETISFFYKSYPALEPYFKKVHRDSQEKGYILIESFVRRKSFIPNWEEFLNLKRIIDLSRQTGIKADSLNWKRFFTVKGQIERTSQNYGIQGQAASMTKLALVLFRHYIKKEGLDAHLVACVHDEIIVESDIAQAQRVGEILRESMLYAGRIFCTSVAMTSEQNIGKHWSH